MADIRDRGQGTRYPTSVLEAHQRRAEAIEQAKKELYLLLQQNEQYRIGSQFSLINYTGVAAYAQAILALKALEKE